MPTRRSFVIRSLGAAAALAAIPGTGPFSLRWVSPAQAAPLRDLPSPPWAARHGLSGADFQTAFDSLGAQGFRLIDVSGYESNGQARYSGIWEQSPGPAWVAFHGVSGEGYQVEFNRLTAEGFRPVRVSGFGVGRQERYAAIFEQRAGPAWAARHGMSASDYQLAFNQFGSNGFRLVDLCGYEAGGEPRFAAIWEQEDGPAWQGRHGLSGSAFQTAFNQLGSQGYRLVRVSGYEDNGSDHYAAIWSQGGDAPWQGRHGVPLADYQQTFDDLRHQGYRPIQVAGYAAGGTTRFAGIWENRVFSSAELGGMDAVVDAFMKKHSVPGLSLATANDDRLVFAKGYGVADKATSERVTTSSRFRVASVSKPITAVAIYRLAEMGRLSLSDTVFGANGVLGTEFGTQPYKANIDTITVEQLLEHTAGFPTNDNNDPMFRNNSFTHARLISDVLDTRDLLFTPGTSYRYSNFGYCVLGRIIEEVTGQRYQAWVTQHILAPSGVSGMELGGNAQADRLPDEVVYYTGTGNPYGMNVSRMDAHGGWIATAVDLVRFGVHVNGLGGKADLLSSASITSMTTRSSESGDSNYARGWAVNDAKNWWHNGALPGTASILVRTQSGMCWAALINTWQRDAGIEGDLDTMMWDVTKKIAAWPGHDLF